MDGSTHRYSSSHMGTGGRLANVRTRSGCSTQIRKRLPRRTEAKATRSTQWRTLGIHSARHIGRGRWLRCNGLLQLFHVLRTRQRSMLQRGATCCSAAQRAPSGTRRTVVHCRATWRRCTAAAALGGCGRSGAQSAALASPAAASDSPRASSPPARSRNRPRCNAPHYSAPQSGDPSAASEAVRKMEGSFGAERRGGWHSS